MVLQASSANVTVRTLLLLKLLHTKMTFANMQFQVIVCLSFVTTKMASMFPLHVHRFHVSCYALFLHLFPTTLALDHEIAIFVYMVSLHMLN